MSIRIREVNNVNILDIEGRIDINSSEIIETAGWLVNTGKARILLNFTGVDIVDYNGLSILAIAYKNVVNHNGKMKFLSVSLPVIELFKVVKLENVFEVYADEKTAVESFDDESAQNQLHHLRRKFKRLDIHLAIKYRIVSGQKKPNVFDGKGLNISAAGVYVYSPYTFPLNTLLDLEVYIPNIPAPLEAQGRVVYLADEEIQPHSYPGMGVAFIHLAPETEKVIVDFIDKNASQRSEPL